MSCRERQVRPDQSLVSRRPAQRGERENSNRERRQHHEGEGGSGAGMGQSGNSMVHERGQAEQRRHGEGQRHPGVGPPGAHEAAVSDCGRGGDDVWRRQAASRRSPDRLAHLG
jgi:hypothetical protein